jgi:hypothetical protein
VLDNYALLYAMRYLNLSRMKNNNFNEQENFSPKKISMKKRTFKVIILRQYNEIDRLKENNGI